MGDLIYSLPNIQYLCKKENTKAILYIALDVPSTYKEGQHPMGSVMLSKKGYDLLYPLLAIQPYIHEVLIWNNEEIDYDMDKFRTDNLNLSGGNISTWIQSTYPEMRPDLNLPWLHVEPIENDYIIINRSGRYRNMFFDYNLALRGYKNIKFVGVDDEWKAFSMNNPDAERLIISDYLELSQYIKGSRLFIGNQSSPFALAEGLKSKRVLEQYVLAPNVLTQGGEYYFCHTNEQFQHAIKKSLETNHGNRKNQQKTKQEEG